MVDAHPGTGIWQSRVWWLTILSKVAVHPWYGGWPSMTVVTWSSFGELSVSVKYHVCSTLPFVRFWQTWSRNFGSSLFWYTVWISSKCKPSLFCLLSIIHYTYPWYFCEQSTQYLAHYSDCLQHHLPLPGFHNMCDRVLTRGHPLPWWCMWSTLTRLVIRPDLN